MRDLHCPTCDRRFVPNQRHFCTNCKTVTLHFDATANRLNRGNNWPQCTMCGGETDPEEALLEHERFKKMGDAYVAPEDY